MTSPYLDRPLLPLAVALPRMLDRIEAELAVARPTRISGIVSGKLLPLLRPRVKQHHFAVLLRKRRDVAPIR